VSERYRIAVHLRRLEAWFGADADPLDLRLRLTHPDKRVEEFAVELVADGMRLWVQLALLEACEQAARVATVLRDIGGDWWVHAEHASQLYTAGEEEDAEDQDRQADHYIQEIKDILVDIRNLEPTTSLG